MGRKSHSEGKKFKKIPNLILADPVMKVPKKKMEELQKADTQVKCVEFRTPQTHPIEFEIKEKLVPLNKFLKRSPPKNAEEIKLLLEVKALYNIE